METKRAKVVMLPTEDEIGSLYGYKDKSMLFNYNPEGYIKTEAEKEYTEHYHLYFTTDDEIKEGDWYLIKVFKGDNKYKLSTQPCRKEEIHLQSSYDCKKVVASTEKLIIKNYGISLDGDIDLNEYIPQPSQAFIEKYCKVGGIDEVLIEEECFISTPMGEGYRIKVDNHNTITIHPIKDSWNREEVAELIDRKCQDYIAYDTEEVKQWIQENL
jgi:hypothetical protein